MARVKVYHAQVFANAIVMHGLDLWQDEEEMTAALEGKWVYEQHELLEEQQLVIVEGYGFEDLAFFRRPRGPDKSDRCCNFCGCAWSESVLEHRKAHFLASRAEVDNREIPSEPPMPHITVPRRPPTLRVDQAAGDQVLSKFVRRVEERARRKVETGKVKASVVKLAGLARPDVNAALVGKTMEYTFQVRGRCDGAVGVLVVDPPHHHHHFYPFERRTTPHNTTQHHTTP